MDMGPLNKDRPAPDMVPVRLTDADRQADLYAVRVNDLELRPMDPETRQQLPHTEIQKMRRQSQIAIEVVSRGTTPSPLLATLADAVNAPPSRTMPQDAQIAMVPVRRNQEGTAMGAYLYVRNTDPNHPVKPSIARDALVNFLTMPRTSGAPALLDKTMREPLLNMVDARIASVPTTSIL